MRWWRAFQTRSGARPVKKFLNEMEPNARTEVLAAMKDVKVNGVAAARHLRGDIWEVKAGYQGDEYRILFSREGPLQFVLLTLHAIKKKTTKTPDQDIRLAQKRLADWRSRGKV